MYNGLFNTQRSLWDYDQEAQLGVLNTMIQEPLICVNNLAYVTRLQLYPGTVRVSGNARDEIRPCSVISQYPCILITHPSPCYTHHTA